MKTPTQLLLVSVVALALAACSGGGGGTGTGTGTGSGNGTNQTGGHHGPDSCATLIDPWNALSVKFGGTADNSVSDAEVKYLEPDARSQSCVIGDSIGADALVPTSAISLKEYTDALVAAGFKDEGGGQFRNAPLTVTVQQGADAEENGLVPAEASAILGEYFVISGAAIGD